ncbi:response regulator, partial [Nocardioides sp.]|uniref:response regulator transcription factor n=1 Tax=Nocardioides sp. TaxID=35761 RepID=UPI002EDB9F0D
MQPGSEWVAVIIEDEPDVRDLIDIVLTQSGFRTVVTENGPDGVEAVRQHNPLITTLDVNMPGMDGFAVAKRLREFSNTYLIMITALADEIDVVQGFEAGADDYLVKPFRPRELRARADSMLRRPRTRFETPAGWAGDDAAAPAQEHAPQQESWAAAAARDLAANHPLQPLHPEPAAPP